MKPSARAPRARIDWEAARRRLADLVSQPASDASSRQAILVARAASLAVPLSASAELGRWLELLTFRSGPRHYAIESRWVLEVAKCGRVSRVPGAAPVMLGITNLRGDLLPVFDVGMLLDAGTSERVLAPHLLVLGEHEPDFGILGDAVEDVVRLLETSLTDGSALGALPYPEQIRGITQKGCVVLDGGAMLRERQLFSANGLSSVASKKEEQ